MKKYILYTGIIALLLSAGAIAVSCRKPAQDPSPADKTISLKLNANVEAPEGKPSDPTIAEWGGEEQATLRISGSNGSKNLSAAPTENAGKLFEFELSSDCSGKELTLGAFYPSSAVSGNSDDFRVNLPAEQNASEGKFDRTGLLFMAVPENAKMPAEGGEATWDATFHIATALTELTISGLSEPVNSVEITVPSGIEIAGERILNLDEGVPGEITSGTNTIRINYPTATGTDGNATVMFSSWGAEIPADSEISITINGKQSTTIASGRGISLVEGQVNSLYAEITSGGEELPVTDELEGRWLVGAADGDGNWVLMTPEQNSTYFTGLWTNVKGDIWSISGNSFAGVSGVESCVWTITPCGSGYSLTDGNGKYLEIYGEKKVRLSDSETALSVTRNSDGTVTIANPGNSGYGNLKYNIGAPRFTTYTSSGTNLPLVSLIPWDKEITPTLIIDNPDITVDAGATSATFKYSAAGITSSISASATSDPDGIVASVSAASGTLRVTLNPNTDEREKKATVTLSAEGLSAKANITQRAFVSGGGDGGGSTVEGEPGWLELPAYLGTEDYINTLYAGSDRNYTYWYNKGWYTSMWVAYPLYDDAMGSGRSDNWAANPQIPKNEQINVWDGSYGVSVSGTIYSRGHQIANGDRNGNSAMQRQTFYATNSTPQIQDKFNGGIWNNLENAIQNVASGRDTVYVVTGPTFETVGGSEQVKWIQPKHDSKKAPVPNYYWKAVLKVKRSAGVVTDAMAVGFWFEHRQYSDSYENYTVSVDEIERLTGLDLFVNLPDSVESKAESNTSWSSFRNF